MSKLFVKRKDNERFLEIKKVKERIIIKEDHYGFLLYGLLYKEI